MLGGSGDTDSKTTIHRYLKELEDTERGRDAVAIPQSEQLTNLIGQMFDRISISSLHPEAFGKIRRKLSSDMRITSTEILAPLSTHFFNPMKTL